MDNLIKENEKKIEAFDYNYYLNCKNYQMAAALSALETTNEIQKSFYKTEADLEVSDYVLRLYALLQGLFVSVDSLYALSYALTKSKNFININNNKDLRELKYIRNDVVGHPSNRVLNKDVLAYCILDNGSISKKSFVYNIYTKDSITKKEVMINDLLTSYYKESNALLDQLYKIAVNGMKNNDLEILISKTIDIFNNDGDYLPYYEEFKKRYHEHYPNIRNNQNRALWRCGLIDNLLKYRADNELEYDLVNHCIGLELNKIYELIFNLKYKVENVKKLPVYVSALYRMLNKNKDLYVCLDYLKDTTNPMFLTAIRRMKNTAILKKLTDVISYLSIIEKHYNANDLDLVYSLALPMREYKRK